MINHLSMKIFFQPADFKHDYTQEFNGPTNFLSANVRGPVSFAVSAASSQSQDTIQSNDIKQLI